MESSSPPLSPQLERIKCTNLSNLSVFGIKGLLQILRSNKECCECSVFFDLHNKMHRTSLVDYVFNICSDYDIETDIAWKSAVYIFQLVQQFNLHHHESSIILNSKAMEFYVTSCIWIMLKFSGVTLPACSSFFCNSSFTKADTINAEKFIFDTMFWNIIIYSPLFVLEHIDSYKSLDNKRKVELLKESAITIQFYNTTLDALYIICCQIHNLPLSDVTDVWDKINPFPNVLFENDDYELSLLSHVI